MLSMKQHLHPPNKAVLLLTQALVVTQPAQPGKAHLHVCTSAFPNQSQVPPTNASLTTRCSSSLLQVSITACLKASRLKVPLRCRVTLAPLHFARHAAYKSRQQQQD